MNKEKLMELRERAEMDLVLSLKEFVRSHGVDCTDYERNVFGLDIDEEDGSRVTKVLNFYDNEGCYFFEPDKVNDDGLKGMNDENYYDRLYENVVYTAYQCLFIVVDKDGNETLKYYRFTNGGVMFDDVQAEPDHGNCMRLTLHDLHYILETIEELEFDN